MSAIKYLRNKHKLTLHKLQDITGIDNANLSRLEHGKGGISNKKLIEIAQLLKEDPDLILIAHGRLPETINSFGLSVHA